jgi:hypothetical protein
MNLLTEDAQLVCKHELGKVDLKATQDLVTIDGRRVLVERNPERRPIISCPNTGPTIKPCQTTVTVEKGYSRLIRIDGKRACLDILTGLTDGTPPGTVKYTVKTPGQKLVFSDS